MTRKILITGATGQVGSKVIDRLRKHPHVEVVAAVRSANKAAAFQDSGLATAILDLDDESTHLPALQGVDTLFLLTGYTVDMLRQSKAILDNAATAGVQHVVHLGACGRDDTTPSPIGRGTSSSNGTSSGKASPSLTFGLRPLCRTC